MKQKSLGKEPNNLEKLVQDRSTSFFQCLYKTNRLSSHRPVCEYLSEPTDANLYQQIIYTLIQMMFPQNILLIKWNDKEIEQISQFKCNDIVIAHLLTPVQHVESANANLLSFQSEHTSVDEYYPYPSFVKSAQPLPLTAPQFL